MTKNVPVRCFFFLNRFSCELPYWRLERVNMRLQRLEEEMYQLQESAVLFEVVIPEFKYMKACRKELRMLKVTLNGYMYVKMRRNKFKLFLLRKF